MMAKEQMRTCLDPCRSLVVSGMKKNVYSDIRPSVTSVCSFRARRDEAFLKTLIYQLLQKSLRAAFTTISHLQQVSVYQQRPRLALVPG